MKKRGRKRPRGQNKQLRPFEELFKKVFAKDRIIGILVR